MREETVGTLAGVIGKKGVFHYASLSFEVEIHDVRQSYGRTDYYVKPVAGTGEQWVSSSSVTLN